MELYGPPPHGYTTGGKLQRARLTVGAVSADRLGWSGGTGALDPTSWRSKIGFGSRDHADDEHVELTALFHDSTTDTVKLTLEDAASAAKLEGRAVCFGHPGKTGSWPGPNVEITAAMTSGAEIDIPDGDSGYTSWPWTAGEEVHFILRPQP